MSSTNYSRLSPSVELSSLPAAEERVQPNAGKKVALGKPSRKPNFSKLDLSAVVCSLACLAASICVVTPHLDLSWWLRYEGQIVVIGFLLSIMNLCLKKVAPMLFLVLEARWGASRLQNYEAIMRNTVWISHTGWLWRGILLLLVALPLGLSAAYKRFTGGHSSAPVHPKFPAYYGLAYPPLGTYNTVNNSIYFLISANVPFMAASSNDSIPPPFATLPQAYGYNTLLLDNTSAALLDMPMQAYVSSIQRNLTNNEFWEMSATVNATIARYNTSTETFRDDDVFWENAFGWSDAYGQMGLSSFELFNNYELGIIPGISGISDGAFSLIGNYPGKTVWSGYENDWTAVASVAFRASALLFNIRRETCAGTWHVNRTAIELKSGTCSNNRTNQTLLMNAASSPFPLDAIPVLAHSQSLGGFTGRQGSPWLIPAFATAVATSYWARMIYSYTAGIEHGPYGTEIYYPAVNERVISTTVTLDANWALYFVLVVQPLLILAIFLITLLLYSTPVGDGLGFVAVLSGIDRDSLDVLGGAALSGELREPVGLEISVVNDGGKDKQEKQMGRIEYKLGKQERRANDTLKRGKVYM